MDARSELDQIRQRAEQTRASRHLLGMRETTPEKDRDRLVAALTAVLDLADRWERGATRWADPLPVPPEVEQVRAAITEHLTNGDDR